MRTFYPFSAVLEMSEAATMAPSAARPSFVRDVTDPEVADSQRYGGKASGLSRMMAAGVPAPPAFVIGAEGFHQFRVKRPAGRRRHHGRSP